MEGPAPGCLWSLAERMFASINSDAAVTTELDVALARMTHGERHVEPAALSSRRGCGGVGGGARVL